MIIILTLIKKYDKINIIKKEKFVTGVTIMKRKCKGIISIFIAIIMLFSIMSCNPQDEEQSSSTPPAQTVSISFVAYTEESIESILREVGKAYGVLPIPTRTGYEFKGWYTEGYAMKIEETTIVENGKAHTLYALWDEGKAEKPDLPQYAPDPVPTEKLSIQPTKVAGGLNCFLMIDEEGYLWARGSNTKQQLGNGASGFAFNPYYYNAEKVLEDVRFRSVSANGSYVLAIDVDGGLWLWGYYLYFGEMSGATEGKTPTHICTDKTFIQADASKNSYGYAIDTEGNLFQLGFGNRNEPIKAVPFEEKVSYVKGDNLRTYVIDETGNLWMWGQDFYDKDFNRGEDIQTPTQITTGTKFVSVVPGSNCFYALDENGSLWGAGKDDGALLWDKETKPTRLLPEKYFTSIHGGSISTFAIDVQGKLWGWGNSLICGLTNDTRGAIVMQGYPIEIETSVAYEQIAVTTLSTSALALDENGELWGWGFNEYGQINDSMQPWYTPRQVMENLRFAKVSCKDGSTLAIDTEGNLWEWGNCLSGEKHFRTERIRQVMPGKTFKEVEAGISVSYAIDTDGTLWSWGKSLRGLLGTGVKESEKRTPVAILKNTKFKKVVTGQVDSDYGFTYAIDENDCLWGWGFYAEHYCGDVYKSVITPLKLFNGTKFVDVTTSSEMGLAIDKEGKGYIWDEKAPRISTDACKFVSTVASKEGTVYCNGYYYAFDAEGNFLSYNPVDILSLGTNIVTKDYNFTSVSVGRVHTLVLDSDGKIWTWNDNSYGQLGNGTTQSVLITERINVMPEKRFTYICAGVYSSFAIDTEGKLWAWGKNANGELNADTKIHYLTPQKMQWN